MNKISATGRVVADAELRYTPSGDAICNFRIASDVGFGDKKATNWFSCQIWSKRGEALAPHLTKGLPVTVFGTLTLREWTNKDGVRQLSPDIRVDEIELHGSKQSSDEAPQRSAKPAAQSKRGAGQHPDMDDDLDNVPF